MMPSGRALPATLADERSCSAEWPALTQQSVWIRSVVRRPCKNKSGTEAAIPLSSSNSFSEGPRAMLADLVYVNDNNAAPVDVRTDATP